MGAEVDVRGRCLFVEGDGLVEVGEAAVGVLDYVGVIGAEGVKLVTVADVGDETYVSYRTTT